MSDRLPSSLDDFGSRLRDAAARRVEKERRESRRVRLRRRRTALATLAAVLLPAAAIAGAGSLLRDDGRPLEADPDLPASARPAADPTVLAGGAVPDPDGGLPWAMRVFSNPLGEQCIALGRLRDGTIGRLRRGEFNPLPPDTGGLCGQVAERGVIASIERRTTPRGRTIVYGLVEGSARITVRVAGERRSARPRALGSFIFVFRGIRDLRGAEVRTTRDGRPVVIRLG